MRIYLNGQLADIDSSSNTTTTYFGSGNPVAMIGMRFNATLPFYGVIDDLTFFNRAVADSEVIGLYNHQFLGQKEINKNVSINIFPNPTQNEINISLDGPAEIHNEIRGHKNSYQRAIEGIEVLMAQPKRPKISIYCVIKNLSFVFFFFIKNLI